MKVTKAASPGRHAKVEDNDTYLVTGGGSGIGLEICKSLAGRAACNFIVLGRKPLPARSEWTQPARFSPETAERIGNLRQIEEKGSRVEYHSVDVADEKGMEEVFKHIRSRFTKVKGVIHSAGVGTDRVPLEARAFADFRARIIPKVQGTLLLARQCAPLSPDFFVLFSSLNALVPQKHSVDYAAANAFEDGFATSRQREKTRFIAVNWPAWSEVGKPANALPEAQPGNGGLQPITTENGIKAFYQALALDKPSVAVAEINLQTFRSNPFFLVGNAAPPALPAEPGPAGAADDRKPVGSLTDIEQKVLEIWYEVLKADHIKTDDDFFEIGGHSLNGTQVTNRVEKEFGVELEFEHILEYSTVTSLSAYIASLLEAGRESTFTEIKHVPDQDYYELSHAQKRLWLLNQFEGVQTAYNLMTPFKFTGPLDVAALEKAFGTLISRHEILRTTFPSVEGKPKQRIHPARAADYRIERIDFSGNVQEIDGIISREANTPFDLENGPLLRTRLLTLNDQSHLFLFSMHHIIADAWSMQVIKQEVLNLYNAYCQGQEIQLPALTTQYKDYASWQNQQLEENALSAHREYWLNAFRGALPVLELPLDYPRPARMAYRGDAISFSLNPYLTQGLKARIDEGEATLFMGLAALVKIALYRYTGQSDLIVGTPVAGRSHINLEDQIGFYINTLALRTYVQAGSSFADVLATVKNTMVNAYKYQDYPFDRLIEDLNMKRDFSRFPLFDVSIVLQNADIKTDEEPLPDGLVIGYFPRTQSTSKYDLLFNFVEAPDEVLIDIEYNVDLFRKESILILKERMLALIADVTASPGKDIDLLDFTTSFETEKVKAALFDDFNF
ncbi:MAG: SDR family NAD(P)-dependent oxidoreductase [Cytophagales bacterium]|nr:SDR family NAD(P)-dependent oxidoreductase [Cytophagales bacterium]